MIGERFIEISTSKIRRYFHNPKHGKIGPILTSINVSITNLIRFTLLAIAGLAYVRLGIWKIWYEIRGI